MLDTSKISRLLVQARQWLTGASHVLDLAIRLYVANAFFSSGLTKIRDWDSTLALFQDEYHVPLLPPEVAAVMGTFGELFFPVLLALGFASRFAAFSLTVVNIMAVIAYYYVLKDIAGALAQHFYWGALLLVTLLHGPGKIALDNFIWPKALRATV